MVQIILDENSGAYEAFIAKITDALEPFDKDASLLAEAGKSSREIRLMREMLQYNEKRQ